MKIGEFGLISKSSAQTESTKLTVSSNRFNALFQSLAKSGATSVKVSEDTNDTVPSKTGLQTLLKVLTNNDVTKLESFSSTADSEGEKADPINILHTILNDGDTNSDLNENTLHQMAEKVEKAFSKVEKQLFNFIQSFNFDAPTENMFAETPLPKLVDTLKGIQLAGKETSLLQNEKEVIETVEAVTNLVSQLIKQSSSVVGSNVDNDNISDLTDTEDSLTVADSIIQDFNRPNDEKEGYIDGTKLDKNNGLMIDIANEKVQPGIVTDSAFETKKKTQQTVSQKANDLTASDFSTGKTEQTKEETANVLTENNERLLKNGKIISEDKIIHDPFSLSNDELKNRGKKASLVNQEKINTATDENNKVSPSSQLEKFEEIPNIVDENIPDFQFGKESNKTNSELLSFLQIGNRISPQMTTIESTGKSADSDVEIIESKNKSTIQSKSGKASEINTNIFSTSFLEETVLREKIIPIDKMVEQFEKVLDFESSQGQIPIDHDSAAINTTSLEEIDLNGRKQPIAKGQTGLPNQMSNQGEEKNTNNLFSSISSEETGNNSGIPMGQFNRKATEQSIPVRQAASISQGTNQLVQEKEGNAAD
ncbi:hypothetical protein, partial [Niallia nealsonii]